MRKIPLVTITPILLGLPFLYLTNTQPVQSDSFSVTMKDGVTTYDYDSEGIADGKIKVNGKKLVPVKADPVLVTPPVSIVSFYEQLEKLKKDEVETTQTGTKTTIETSNSGGSSQVSVKTQESSQTVNSNISSNSNIKLKINHEEGSEPDEDGKIEVTINGETVYSNEGEAGDGHTEIEVEGKDEVTVVEENTEEPALEEESLHETESEEQSWIERMLDTILTNVQNLWERLF